ncbi:MAG: HNH endonuclease, partial [Blastocatellia bacterium]
GWIDPQGLGSLSGVDFTGSPDLYPVTGSQQNIVQIPMQGSRGRDFTQAYKASGINEADAGGYTWHHVNDFDPATGQTTMQLVETSAHEATFPHEGSVRQFEQTYKVSYDSPEAVKVSYENGWLKGRVPKGLQGGCGGG